MMNFKKIIKLKKIFLKTFLFILLTFFLKKLSLAQTSPSGKLDLPDSGYTKEEVVVTIWANHPDGVDFVALKYEDLKYEDEAKVLKFAKHPESCNFQKECERRFSLTWSLEGKYVVCGYFKGKDGILRDTKPDCKEILIEKRIIPPGEIVPPPKLPGLKKPIVIPYPGAPKPGKEAGAPIIKEPQMPTPKEGCEKTKSCQSCPSECVCSCKSSCEKDCKKYEDDLEAYKKCINECKEKASGGILPCNKKYDDPSTRGCDCCPCSLCSLFLLLKRVIDFLFYPLAFALFIISLIISGILFITQGGRPERIKAARNTLTLSCLGFGLILASWVLINTWLGVLTKETEGGIATIFGKRWNQIECPLPKGECTIFQPPLPQRYFCGDGFVIGDEECDPKEPYFRFYLRTKKDVWTWTTYLERCQADCTLKKACDENFKDKVAGSKWCERGWDDIGKGCYLEDEPNPERCLSGAPGSCVKGICVCDPNQGEYGKVVCANVFGDPKYKNHPNFIKEGYKIVDECCCDPSHAEFKTGEIVAIYPEDIAKRGWKGPPGKVWTIGGWRYVPNTYTCDDVCKEFVNGFCVGVGLSDTVAQKCQAIQHNVGWNKCNHFDCDRTENLYTNNCKATYGWAYGFGSVNCRDANCVGFGVGTTGCYCRVLPTKVTK